MRPSKIKLGLAVLSLGTALAAVPAFAASYGDHAPRVSTHRHMMRHGRAHATFQASGQRTGSASNEEARAPGGNTYAFGAQGRSSGADFHYPIGRPVNSGGPNYGIQTAHTASPTGGQRTGSFSNEQAQTATPHGNLYAFGGQGQPPGAGYHYPVGRPVNSGGPNYGMQTER